MGLKSIIFKQNKCLRTALLLNFIFFLVSNAISAKTIRVAVASNFLKPAQQLATAFEAQSEHKVQISSGSSGKLYLQISHGAPYDLFLSADQQKPQKLVEQKLALKSSLQTYTIGKLVLWIKPAITNCRSILEINQSNITKIAIANPKLAPYGLATRQLLDDLGLWKSIKNKIILSENISQVAQLAKLGVIEAAFISASHKKQLQNIQPELSQSKNKNCFIKIDQSQYPIIKQQLVILSKSNKKAIAQSFIQFMKSQQGQSLINNMGYYSTNSDKIPLS